MVDISIPKIFFYTVHFLFQLYPITKRHTNHIVKFAIFSDDIHIHCMCINNNCINLFASCFNLCCKLN